MPPSLAELIRSGRIRKGWNQSELAEKAGVARTTLVQLERGTVQEPHATTLKKVGELLDISPEALASARIVERPSSSAPEVISEQVAFDRATNSTVAAIREQLPERFRQLSSVEEDTLTSQFGVGGALTTAGVMQSLERMEADRQTLAQLQIVLQTHLRDAARQIIDGLYRSVAVVPHPSTTKPTGEK
ncbi:MAG: helix-turn-helix domain-containing protein [Planctomycetaceae bacterium]|nr:helix-turn-helix domain-containing protein [Planctomycetaceae bacterium]